jgi:hypothetical protein
MASLVITETAGISVVELRVFERNGLAYANTRDLAAFAGRDHRVAVRSLERALKRQPHLLGKWVFEALLYDEAKRLRYTDRQAKMGRAGRQVVDVEVVRAIPPSLNRVRFETHRFRSRSSLGGLGR